MKSLIMYLGVMIGLVLSQLWAIAAIFAPTPAARERCKSVQIGWVIAAAVTAVLGFIF